MLTPAVVHALVAAGASAAMLAAAFEADYKERTNSRMPSEPVEAKAGQSRPAVEAVVGYRRAHGDDGVVGDPRSVGTLTAPRDMHDTMRGIAAAMRDLDGETNSQGVKPMGTRARAADSDLDTVNDRSRALSLSKDPLSLSIMAVDSGNYGDSPHPLPIGFQPDQKTKAYVIKRLGEVQAEAMMLNFRERFWARPEEKETTAGWNERLRAWSRKEKGYQRGQAVLPLMRPISGGQAWERRRESG